MGWAPEAGMTLRQRTLYSKLPSLREIKQLEIGIERSIDCAAADLHNYLEMYILRNVCPSDSL